MLIQPCFCPARVWSRRHAVWTVGALACLVGASGCRSASSRAKDADGFNIHGKVVPLKLERKGDNLYVEATVCGKGPYVFLVDTGSGIVAVTSEVARAAGLKPNPKVRQKMVGSAGVAIRGTRTSIARIEIPNLAAENVAAAIMPEDVSATLVAAVHPRFGGALGMNLFNGVLLEIDCAKMEMTLKPRRLAPKKPSYSYAEIPSVPAQVGSHHFTLEIDSGSTCPCILSEGNILPVREEKPVRVTWVTVGPSYTVDTWRLAVDLTVGNATNRNLPFYFERTPSLALPVLGTCIVTIDNSAKRLWLESQESLIEWH